MSSDKLLIQQLADAIEVKLAQIKEQDDFYVAKILDAIATITQSDGIRDACITPQSIIGDFFLSWWQNDTAQMPLDLAALQSGFGFKIEFSDLISDVSKKLTN